MNHEIKVPIPSELPAKPNLEELPSHVVRSGAVESLIEQNEDLMARLSVSLRRIALLEESLSENNKKHIHLKKEHERFKDQVLILREKVKAISERHQKEDNTLEELKRELRLREIEFAEYYSSSKERQAELLNKISSLSRRNGRFLKYRNNIQSAIQNLKAKHKNQIEEKLDFIHEKNALIQNLEKNIGKLEAELRQEIESNSRLKNHIQESTQHIQAQAKQFKEDQQNLVEGYEEKLSESQRSISTLKTQVQTLEKKNAENEGLYEKSVNLENKLVLSERQQSEIKGRYEIQIEELQKSLAQYRSEAKTKTLELESKNQDLVTTHNELVKLKKTHSQSQEQVENLQCLWRENNAQLEKQKEKNKALQKLNQQLSVKMNEYRQEIYDLKSQLESAQILTSQKVRELRGQVQAVTEIKAQETLEASSESEKVDSEFNPDLMNKIDGLIEEIHTAFNSQPQTSSETTIGIESVEKKPENGPSPA